MMKHPDLTNADRSCLPALKLVVFGAGYVGLSNAVLLAQRGDVTVVDLSEARVQQINQRRSPFADRELEAYLAERPLRLGATTDAASACAGADFILICTPTDYDPRVGRLNTSTVEAVIETALAAAPEAVLVIKSTVPVGYTESMRTKTGHDAFLFAPEFLREGQALHDCLYPSRIVIGVPAGSECLAQAARTLADLFIACAEKPDVEAVFMTSGEAEAVKLFSDAHLALRVGFFNELDSFAELHGFDARAIIEGVCLDPRIGSHYNNPSFGYGGVCLPKDTRQLLADCGNAPHELIGATVETNEARKDFVAERILAKAGFPQNASPVIGIYRLRMKAEADDCRQSAVQGVLHRLCERGVEPVVYEPTLEDAEVFGLRVIRTLAEFKAVCDVICANRRADELEDVAEKLYTRDIFGRG